MRSSYGHRVIKNIPEFIAWDRLPCNEKKWVSCKIRFVPVFCASVVLSFSYHRNYIFNLPWWCISSASHRPYRPHTGRLEWGVQTVLLSSGILFEMYSFTKTFLPVADSRTPEARYFVWWIVSKVNISRVTNCFPISSLGGKGENSVYLHV